MSTQITTAFVQQYGSAFRMLAQQKQSRLRQAVLSETVTGTNAYFDQIGAPSAQLKGARHGNTPQIDTPHSRRQLSLAAYVWSDLIDSSDKVLMLGDPTSSYIQAGVAALNRSMDDVIIAAALGTANTGVSGGTPVALPNSQKVVSANAGGTAGARLNVTALRRARQKFLAADVDPSTPLYIAVDDVQLMSLLEDTQVTSADFNTVKALVQGELDTFMGFKFIRTQRLLAQSGALSVNFATGVVGSGTGDANGYRRCFAWAQDGIMLGLGRDIKTRLSERDDKNYSVQAYAEMDIGATRMEEVKVCEILCVAT